MFGIAHAACVAVTTDPDMWWHLRTGDVIVNQGLPREDIFSFTVPGREWVTHEWLSQVVMWFVYQAGGLAGLMVGFALVGLAAFFIAFRTSTAPAGSTAAVMGTAAMATAVISGSRPQMFNLVGVAMTVWILERVRHSAGTNRGEKGDVQQTRARLLWLLVPLLVIWANLHSGFLLGFAVIAVYLVGESLSRRHGDPRPTMSTALTTRLGLVATLAFLATALNPSGPALWKYPIDTLRSSAMRTLIIEWHSPNFHDIQFWPFLALLLGGAALAAVSRPSVRWTQGLLLIGTAAASLQSVRHIPIFGVIAIPIIAPLLHEALLRRAGPERSQPKPEGMLTRLSGIFGAAFGVALLVAMVPIALEANDDAIAQKFPVAAVDFLKDTGLDDERGFNAYHWGGYLIWEDIDVFVDGRADVYGDEFLLAYVDTSEVTPVWQQALDEHDVDWILIGAKANLNSVLAESDEWEREYADEVSVIYTRVL